MDPSDEATGLPPLDEPRESDTIWVGVMAGGAADVLSPFDGSPQGAFVLSVRGLVEGIQGAPSDWAQMHVAIPHGSVPALLALVGEYLREHP